MSYQFEDESALEELLNQQLDRRKQTGSRQNPSIRPPTSSSTSNTNPSSIIPQLRPGTASTSLLTKQPTVNERDVKETSSEPVGRGKLASWLAASGADRNPTSDVNIDTQVEPRMLPLVRKDSLLNTTNRSNLNDPTGTSEDLDKLLVEPRLQEMSKQRLVQVILEQIVPAMQNLRIEGGKKAARELEQVKEALQSERNRTELLEMRCEERVKLEELKWQQLHKQLESRLEASESELSRLMSGQREHLDKLDEQYQRNLSRLVESYEQKLRDEKLRLDEVLKVRDQLHKLELDSKLNVNLDLIKLDAMQAEWRKTLELTIEQLNDQFKSISSLLDKQAHQVNGTNLELTQRTNFLCEQYAKHERSERELGELAAQLGELMPKFSHFQQSGELTLSKACDKLAELSERSSALAERERALDEWRQEFESTREQLQADRLQLALDTSRVQLKEERLNELLKLNSEREIHLSNQRNAQIEEQAHLQTKRVNLDEKANELREQNYGLHLMRKRLTGQKEQIIKTQLELENERKAIASERAATRKEAQQIGELRARVQREMDQMRRLQRSLVCSLCMSRLFDGNNQSIEMVHRDLPLPEGRDSALGRIVARTTVADSGGAKDGNAQVTGDLLSAHMQQVERDASLLARESKYVELLSTTN